MNKSLTATLKYALASYKKMEIVAKMVRGKKAIDSIVLLQNVPNKTAKILNKVVKSAVANAKNNAGLNESDLYISKIYIGKGPQLKRIRFIARSRISSYVKYRSFVKVILDTKK